MSGAERSARYRERKRQERERDELAREVIDATLDRVRELLPGMLADALRNVTPSVTPPTGAVQVREGEASRGASREAAGEPRSLDVEPTSRGASREPGPERHGSGTLLPPPTPPPNNPDNQAGVTTDPGTASQRASQTASQPDDFDDEVIRAVQAAAHLATGRAMDRPTAAAVATLILTGRTVDNPVSYVRRVIRDDPSMLRVEEPEQPPASKRQTCRHHDPCPKVKHCGNCASTEHSLAFCPLIDAEQDRRQAEADALKGYPGAYTRKWTQEVFPDRTDKPDGAQAARVLREELTKRAQSMRGDAEARRRAYTAARAAERAAANGQPDEATRDGAGLDGGGDRKLSDADGPF